MATVYAAENRSSLDQRAAALSLLARLVLPDNARFFTTNAVKSFRSRLRDEEQET